LDGDGDGLAPLYCDWAGKRVFCNPPYGPGLGKWLERGLEAACAVFLIPARTDTRWFHDIVLRHARDIRFLRGRLKFGNAKNPAPFPSMVVVFELSAASDGGARGDRGGDEALKPTTQETPAP